jgi:hypothetical protein
MLNDTLYTILLKITLGQRLIIEQAITLYEKLLKNLKAALSVVRQPH